MFLFFPPSSSFPFLWLLLHSSKSGENNQKREREGQEDVNVVSRESLVCLCVLLEENAKESERKIHRTKDDEQDVALVVLI